MNGGPQSSTGGRPLGGRLFLQPVEGLVLDGAPCGPAVALGFGILFPRALFL